MKKKTCPTCVHCEIKADGVKCELQSVSMGNPVSRYFRIHQVDPLADDCRYHYDVSEVTT